MKKSIRIIAILIVMMGIIHLAATFTPVIGGKLALLPDGAQGAFTYFSLMCGALLVLGGCVLFTLSGKIADYPFTRVPYMLTLVIMSIDGALAVCYMHHNPFAWVIFVLTMGLLYVSLTHRR